MILKRKSLIFVEFQHFSFGRFFRFYGRIVPNGKFVMAEIFDFSKIDISEVPSASGCSTVSGNTFLVANHVSWLFKGGKWESASPARGGREDVNEKLNPSWERHSFMWNNESPATAGVNRFIVSHCRISWNTKRQIQK